MPELDVSSVGIGQLYKHISQPLETETVSMKFKNLYLEHHFWSNYREDLSSTQKNCMMANLAIVVFVFGY